MSISAGPNSGYLQSSTDATSATKQVLFVTDRAFLPPYDGTSNAYSDWLNLLRSGGYRVSVISFNFPQVQWAEASILRLRELAENVLILNAYRSYSAAAIRQAAIILWRVITGRRFLPQVLERLLSRQQKTQIKQFLKENSFDTIIISRINTTALIGTDNLKSINARKIIDMHDNFPQREHLTKRIFVKLANRDAKCAWSLLHPEVIRALCSWASENAMLREEIEVLSTYDRVLFYSAEEADTFIKAGLPSAQVSTLPWACVTKNNLSSAINLHTSHFDVGIIASSAIFNVEGIEYFAREIMPMLAKNGLRPSVLVAGSIGKYARHFFCADDSVEFIDWVEDVSTFYSRVNTVAVPLLSGTGISIKTLEAASYGAPIVSTSVGIRGVSIRPGIDLLLGDSAEDFAGALAKLLADDTLRARLGRSVRDRIKSTHSPSELLRRIRAIV